MDLLENLNEKQKEAVITTEGPVMVLAGAGSGKTRVLTNRVCNLISNYGIDPQSILAVTFTNKAAQEMKTRISKLLRKNTFDMWIHTFHSFCVRVLRSNIFNLKQHTSNFLILDTDDSIKIIKEVLKEKNLDTSIKPTTFQKEISKYKNFKDYVSYINHFDLVYKSYEQKLNDNNSLDFDDLLLKTKELFLKFPDILDFYQEKFNYILVDEFQDTNYIQFELITMLARKHNNIFVVGDQDQSIYSFRGAVVENIDKFLQVYPMTKQILLEENYRSNKQILEIANNVIKNNVRRIDKTLYTNNTNDFKPIYFECNTSFDETRYVTDKIKDLVSTNQYQFKDITILYRNNYLSRNFEDNFVKENINYQIYGGLSFYQRKEIKDIIYYLRLAVDHTSNFVLKRIINEPKRKIGPSLVQKLEEKAKENNVSMFDAIDLLKENTTGNKNLVEFKNMILEIRDQIDELSFSEIVSYVYQVTGYENMLVTDKEEERIENIKELFSVFAESAEAYSGTNIEKLEQFLLDLSLKTDADNKNDNKNAVKMMTFHQAKGLEFKVVFMVALEDEIFPGNLYEDIEEERRICYVGITRAMERLYLTNSTSRFLFGQTNHMTRSRFIKEAKLINNVKPITRVVIKEEKTEVVSNVSYNVGDKVEHKIFGQGLVVEVKGNILSVAFKVPHGIKKVQANHPSLSKIN